MRAGRHIPEEELIAYHLREGTDEAVVGEHLERCSVCAEVSESIAETLRVFSAGPVPEPDMERNWQRLRGNLSVLSPAPRRKRLVLWPAAGLAMAAALVLVVFGVRARMVSPSPVEWTAQRVGPLTDAPADPEIANHIDSAERLLTEVNHALGPLDEATRAQAHDLLLKNAVYVQTARQRGDLGEASVLENFGRVLTNLEHESETPGGGWRLRIELHTDGLLLELRVLRQNDLRQ